MIELPKTPFKYREWDCFIFADWIRVRNGDRPLPPIDYHSIPEQNISAKIPEILASYCQPVDYPENGDLAQMLFTKKNCLGTYYQGNLYFMADVAVCRSVERMGWAIASWWRLT